MIVLLIGSGAREHALGKALVADPQVTQLHVVGANPGIAELLAAGEAAHLYEIDQTDGSAIAELARQIGAELVVIGPEAPLVAGVADAIRELGIPVFGPSAAAAQLEGSKAFAKEIMSAAGVPTGEAEVCTDIAAVQAACDRFGSPHVIKDDGLAAGKGVVVTDDLTAALAHAQAVFDGGGRVVVEEFLDGPEVSLFCLSDGKNIIPLAPAQDFKRAYDGDAGPNTGGMGAYSPLPWAPADLTEQVVHKVALPTIRELASRGTPFVGLLYCGLALTKNGVRVIEFNARFGDPETQVVLARLRTPLAGVLLAAAQGNLDLLPPLRWSPQAAVTVVWAAPGYPESAAMGVPIAGLPQPVASNRYVLHAGVAKRDSEYVTAGGRVLSVVGLGDDLDAARAAAYELVHQIDIPGGHFRSDIAARAAQESV